MVITISESIIGYTFWSTNIRFIDFLKCYSGRWDSYTTEEKGVIFVEEKKLFKMMTEVSSRLNAINHSVLWEVD